MRRKRHDERRSPCHNPRLQAIQRPGIPLSTTAEREERKIASIQSHQRGEKP
jgi:hypothetical protein